MIRMRQLGGVGGRRYIIFVYKKAEDEKMEMRVRGWLEREERKEAAGAGERRDGVCAAATVLNGETGWAGLGAGRRWAPAAEPGTVPRARPRRAQRQTLYRIWAAAGPAGPAGRLLEAAVRVHAGRRGWLAGDQRRRQMGALLRCWPTACGRGAVPGHSPPPPAASATMTARTSILPTADTATQWSVVFEVSQKAESTWPRRSPLSVPAGDAVYESIRSLYRISTGPRFGDGLPETASETGGVLYSAVSYDIHPRRFSTLTMALGDRSLTVLLIAARPVIKLPSSCVKSSACRQEPYFPLPSPSPSLRCFFGDVLSRDTSFCCTRPSVSVVGADLYFFTNPFAGPGEPSVVIPYQFHYCHKTIIAKHALRRGVSIASTMGKCS